MFEFTARRRIRCTAGPARTLNTGHELGSALGVALASVFAASSLGVAAAGVGGFRTAFTGAVGIAAVAAVSALRALPAGKPDPSARPAFVH